MRGGSEAAQHHAPPPPRLAYVYSVPLVHRAGSESTEPDMLDTAQELQSLRKTLKEAGRKIVFRAEVATVRNFRFLVTLGCRMLHYTGHGNPTCLIFENDRGEANLLGVEALTELFRAGGVRTQLVFVSACHSESAGKSFAEAGVPHVVAVKYDEKVTDYAARVFAEQFYLSLVTGNTVRNAFQVGIMSIMAESAAAQDTKKFLLLPEDGNHDVAIFGDAQLGEFMDETPKEIKNTVHKPPVFFLGRNSKVQEVVSLLCPQRYRCVTIRGPPGIGKTAVAFRACEYMAERRMFDAIYYVPLHEALFPITDKEALCEAIGTALEKGGARDGRDIVRALQENDVNRRVLLLLDGIDRFLASGSVLIGLLSFLLSKHQALFLLITAENTLNKSGDGLLENTPEKVVELSELSDISSAHLLVYVAPRRLKFEEMTSRPFGAKGEALAQLAASPVLRELHGHPKAIIMFAPLLEGNRLENLQESAKKCYCDATNGLRGGDGEDGALALVFKDPSCERLWLGLTASGKRSHSSIIGVPWYSVANALQQQLKEALALSVRRHRSSSSAGSSPPPAPPDTGAPPPPSHSSSSQAPQPSSESMRGLSDTDIEFLKTKLVSQPNSDLVRGKDFEAFCEWWVPVLNSLRRLAREWLCTSPALLYGFAGRHEAEEMLRGKEEGTFLVRFSTTHLGLLAISFRSSSASGAIQHCLVQVTSEGCDLFMEPARKRYACFEDLLRDCSNLSFLYPGVPKIQALQQLQPSAIARRVSGC